MIDFNVGFVLMFLFRFSAMQSVVCGSGAVLQPLQRRQSEAGESPLLAACINSFFESSSLIKDEVEFTLLLFERLVFGHI